MTLFPPLTPGWLNGWVSLVFIYGILIPLTRDFPIETMDRLYEDSGWTLVQSLPAKMGLPIALAALILMIFTPLLINQVIFWIGCALIVIGEVGFHSSLHTLKGAPAGEQATEGL